MNMKTITAYLDQREIKYKTLGSELSFACPFKNCDVDSCSGETNCYIHAESERLWCYKCNIKGDLNTLINYLDKPINEVKKQKTSKKKEEITVQEESFVIKQVCEVNQNRYFAVKAPDKQLNIDDWRRIINSNFPEFALAFEIAISVPLQLLISDIRNPFALFFIGLPSEGKTIKLNVLDCISELCYSTDKFTASSFVSNSTNVKKDDLKNIDLIPKIKNKLLLIKDAAPLFSKEIKDLKEILGTLTRVLDGEGLLTDTGVHGRRGYKGDYLFMMIGASTPIKQLVWDIMGGLGARIFAYNLTSQKRGISQLIKQLKGKSYKQKEEICKETTSNLLRTLFVKYPDGVNWDTSAEDDFCLEIIATSSILLSRLRGVINLSKDAGSSYYELSDPLVEDPSRINQLLYNLARGHALACDRNKINKEDISIVLAVALDSAPQRRSKIVKKLIANNGVLKTSEIQLLLDKSHDTALREMRVLNKLGVVSLLSVNPKDNSQAEIRLNTDFSWFLGAEYREITSYFSSTNLNDPNYMRTSDTPSQDSGSV